MRYYLGRIQRHDVHNINDKKTFCEPMGEYQPLMTEGFLNYTISVCRVDRIMTNPKLIAEN